MPLSCLMETNYVVELDGTGFSRSPDPSLADLGDSKLWQKFFRVSFEIDIQKVFEQKSNLSSLEMGSRFSSRNSPLVLEKNKLFREKMFGVKQVKQAWVKQNNSSSNP